ncbi:MAG: hypothetical protein Q9159_006573 [Coniocarpon cinnabarinum]
MDDEEEYEVVEDAGLAGQMPQGFGRQARTVNVQAQLDQARRQVLKESAADEFAKKAVEGASDSKSDSNDSDDSDDDDGQSEFPVSHELVIRTHERAVTAATLDAAGNRLVTGSADCTVKYHDLSSMNPTTIRAFKSFDPTETKLSQSNETHPIHQVQFNPNSPSSIFIITAHPQVKVYDRDGELWGTTVKGDMYLRDLHHTKGHTSEATCGDWHPSREETFVTAGIDSTLRVWDINNLRQQKNVIVHKSKQAGSAGRSRMTAVRYHGSESAAPTLVATAFDGSLVTYPANGPYLRPSAEVVDAHEPSTWTSSLDVSPDGRLIITRGGDDTLKLWDTRKLKTALRTAPYPSMASQFPTSSVRFSPSGSQILTGTSTGDLHIFNSATLRPELVTPVSPNVPLTSAFWHDKINQIVTTSADGSTRVLFDPAISKQGAISVMSKAPKHRHIDDDPNRVMDTSGGINPDSIVNPGTGPRAKKQTGLTMSGRSRDPRRPHKPEATPFQQNQPDERHVSRMPLASMRDEDPREALLKYADKAEKDPTFTNAWSQTQPETLYREASPESEGPESKKQKR